MSIPVGAPQSLYERCGPAGRGLPQFSIYSYATTMNGVADEQTLRLRCECADEDEAAGAHRY